MNLALGGVLDGGGRVGKRGGDVGGVEWLWFEGCGAGRVGCKGVSVCSLHGQRGQSLGFAGWC